MKEGAYKKGLKQEDDNVSLFYKDHQEFFQKYHAIRFDYISNMAKSLNNIEALKEGYTSLNALIKWSNSQIKSGGGDLFQINKDMSEVLFLLGKEQHKDAAELLEQIFETVSEIHEKTELIPKIQVQERDQNAKFWRDEESAALKNVKKGFYDVLLVD